MTPSSNWWDRSKQSNSGVTSWSDQLPWPVCLFYHSHRCPDEESLYQRVVSCANTTQLKFHVQTQCGCLKRRKSVPKGHQLHKYNAAKISCANTMRIYNADWGLAAKFACIAIDVRIIGVLPPRSAAQIRAQCDLKSAGLGIDTLSRKSVGP